MIVATTDTIEGRRIVRVLGLVDGSAVRARHIGRDIIAGLRHIVGGEIPEYAKLLAQARQEALQRMTDKAKLLGANAVVGVRFATSMIMQGTAEILVYGTAVIVE